MSLTQCPFCDHSNLADAKFCGECGGALHLAPCFRCGAVNQVTASSCYQCHHALSDRVPDAPATTAPADAPASTRSLPVTFLAESLPLAVFPQSPPRRRFRMVIDTLIVVAIAVLGYNAYQQHRSSAPAPEPPAASSEPSGRVPSASAVSRGVLTVPAGASSGAASATSLPSSAAPARAATEQSRSGRQAVESQQAAGAVTVATRRPQPVSSAKGSAPAAVAQDACTEASAALGLCVMSPARKKAPANAAAGGPAIGSVVTSRREAGAQDPGRPQGCTEAVAALGLCAPGNTQGRE
jgi:hypothetical protein